VNWIYQIVLAFLDWIRATPPTDVQHGKAPEALKDDLADRIADLPGLPDDKVVLVPSGDPVMLAKPTRASVYGFDSNKKLVGPSTVTLPAGWYVLPKN
jgi:hypothetical protein